MEYDDFKIDAAPILTATCKRCHGKCETINDGFLRKAFYCPHCDHVYTLRLVKLPEKQLDPEYRKILREKYRKVK